MAAILESIQQDGLAMSVARALAIANGEAATRGTDLAQSLVTITEESPPPARVWRIHYGPREYRNRRGGDLIVLVDEQAGAVRRVIRGQ
jgi:hypothetical protein